MAWTRMLESVGISPTNIVDISANFNFINKQTQNITANYDFSNIKAVILVFNYQLPVTENATISTYSNILVLTDKGVTYTYLPESPSISVTASYTNNSISITRAHAQRSYVGRVLVIS